MKNSNAGTSSKSKSTESSSSSSFTTRNQTSSSIYSLPPPPPPSHPPPPPSQPPQSHVAPLHKPTIKHQLYPPVPTHQATLPADLQNLSATEVYPNLSIPSNETSPVDVPKTDELTSVTQSSKEITCSTEKKIVWNKRAPDNPFGGAHVYTKEPGAW